MIKSIEYFYLIHILKINLYRNGIYVEKELFQKLNDSKYSGYRTTSGLFLKLGGTLSKRDFEKLNGNYEGLFANYDNCSYEDYLKIREWVTTPIYELPEESDIPTNSTYFILKTDKNQNYVIEGQYFDSENQKHTVSVKDVGIFKQGDYNDDNIVVVQAGGIRLRASICGPNCISGCTFCSFGTAANNYVKNYLNEARLENLKATTERLVLETGVPALFITGGNPSLDDMERWTELVEETIKSFKEAHIEYAKENNTPVKDLSIDVMLSPRSFDKYVDTRENYRKYLEKLKEFGVNTISPNMELWSQETLELYCKSNSYNEGTTKADVGHDGYITFLEEAVKVFGPFNVRSAFIVGLETVENLKVAIDTLISKNIMVTLSPFKSPENNNEEKNPNNINLSKLEPCDNDLIILADYLEKTIQRYFNNLSREQVKIYQQNIDNSLNAHNTHNTSNFCTNHELDYLEKEALKNGFDSSITTKERSFSRMELHDCITARRSIRRYIKAQVSEDDIKLLLESARLAPSAKNRQPWYFVCLDGKEKDTIADIMKKNIIELGEQENIVYGAESSVMATSECIRQGSTLILVFRPNDENWLESDVLSIGAAVENICLTATELGLGSLWIRDTVYTKKEIAKFVNKEDMILSCAVLIGIANENPIMRPRKKFEDIYEYKKEV